MWKYSCDEKQCDERNEMKCILFQWNEERNEEKKMNGNKMISEEEEIVMKKKKKWRKAWRRSIWKTKAIPIVNDNSMKRRNDGEMWRRMSLMKKRRNSMWMKWRMVQ